MMLEPSGPPSGENWMVELDCGHRVRVSIDDGPLVGMAHLTQHHAGCPGLVRLPASALGLGWPLPLPSGAALR